jgi:hypothetical protein
MNNTQIALFDVDGVVIAPRKKYFSDRLVDEFGISSDESMMFVKELLIPSMSGQIDIKKSFPLFLRNGGFISLLMKYWSFGGQVKGI